MKRLIAFPLEEGGEIVVEVEVPEPEGGMEPAGRPGEIVATARQSFEDALERIRPAAQAIITKLRSLHEQPDEIEVEFGLKLSAEAGAFIASAATEANYKVTLKWTQPERKDAPSP